MVALSAAMRVSQQQAISHPPPDGTLDRGDRRARKAFKSIEHSPEVTEPSGLLMRFGFRWRGSDVGAGTKNSLRLPENEYSDVFVLQSI